MKENDCWILTTKGKHFDLRNPRAEDIDVIDISKSLSRLCRFNGHGRMFYSVANHILNGRKHVKPELKKYWDLHDAEEAYLGDVPTPLKNLLGDEFEAIRQNVHKAICERFDLPLDFAEQVKENDLVMLLAEREVLFGVEALTEPWAIDYHPNIEHMKKKAKLIEISNQPIMNTSISFSAILRKYE